MANGADTAFGGEYRVERDGGLTVLSEVSWDVEYRGPGTRTWRIVRTVDSAEEAREAVRLFVDKDRAAAEAIAARGERFEAALDGVFVDRPPHVVHHLIETMEQAMAGRDVGMTFSMVSDRKNQTYRAAFEHKSGRSLGDDTASALGAVRAFYGPDIVAAWETAERARRDAETTPREAAPAFAPVARLAATGKGRTKPAFLAGDAEERAYRTSKSVLDAVLRSVEARTYRTEVGRVSARAFIDALATKAGLVLTASHRGPISTVVATWEGDNTKVFSHRDEKAYITMLRWKGTLPSIEEPRQGRDDAGMER